MESNQSRHPTESKSAESAILALALTSPDHFSGMLSLSPSMFYHYGVMANALHEFWQEHAQAPDADTFAAWNTDDAARAQVKSVTARALPDASKFPTYLRMVQTCALGRGMLGIAEELANSVGTLPHPDMLKRAMAKMSDLTMLASDRATTTRAFYWETAPERWEDFKARSKNPELSRSIPFGIPALDKATRGVHVFESEADLVGIFGKPGTYKTRLMLNLAANQAGAGHRVMLVEREMARRRVELLLDARESVTQNFDGSKYRLEYRLLEDAKLTGRYRTRYMELLQNLYENIRPPIYIVDCPDRVTTADIVRELEIYRGLEGCYPEVLYIDYANLIEPTGDVMASFEKLDVVTLELLGICKGYRIPIITPFRESRTGSLIKASDRADVGIEHIGLSQAVGYHLHQLWHLDHSREDILRNRLWLRLKKNRYGGLEEIPLVVDPEVDFISDAPMDDDGSYDLQL